MSFYKIVLENEHFVIVDKKAMVLSVPGRTGEEDGRPVLGKILEEDLKIKIYPVHRLDFEVSGLIVYAKTAEAHKAGNAWFEKKEVHKTYAAISTALPEAQSNFKVGEPLNWKCKLLRGKKRAYESPHGKESLTSALLTKVENGHFHWELNPITGRSHQLRYELFRHGHPIVGDVLYSSNEKWKEEGIALRSFKIDFSKAPNASKFSLPEILEIEKF